MWPGSGRDSGACRECDADLVDSLCQAGGDVERDVICRHSASGARRSTQVANGVSMDRRWLPNRMRRGVVSLPSSADSNGVRYFDQAWLGKATDVVEGNKRNVN